jgi:hypothetical protein
MLSPQTANLDFFFSLLRAAAAAAAATDFTSHTRNERGAEKKKTSTFIRASSREREIIPRFERGLPLTSSLLLLWMRGQMFVGVSCVCGAGIHSRLLRFKYLPFLSSRTRANERSIIENGASKYLWISYRATCTRSLHSTNT